MHSLVSSLSNQKYVQLCLKHLSHQICFSLPYQPKFAQLLPRPKNAFLQWTSQTCTMAGIAKLCKYVKILIGSKSMTETTKLLISGFLPFCKTKGGKFMSHKWPFHDHFLSFFCQLHRCFSLRIILRCLRCLNLFWIKSYDTYLKSVNIWYITLGHWDDGTNESSTKCVMFQVLFFFHDFLQNALQKAFQFILSFVL